MMELLSNWFVFVLTSPNKTWNLCQIIYSVSYPSWSYFFAREALKATDSYLTNFPQI